jgi:hypothetical protein
LVSRYPRDLGEHQLQSVMSIDPTIKRVLGGNMHSKSGHFSHAYKETSYRVSDEAPSTSLILVKTELVCFFTVNFDTNSFLHQLPHWKNECQLMNIPYPNDKFKIIDVREFGPGIGRGAIFRRIIYDETDCVGNLTVDIFY